MFEGKARITTAKPWSSSPVLTRSNVTRVGMLAVSSFAMGRPPAGNNGLRLSHRDCAMGSEIKASTMRSKSSALKLLPAMYQCSNFELPLRRYAAMARAPSLPTMLLPINSARTASLSPSAANKGPIPLGPTTCLQRSNRPSVHSVPARIGGRRRARSFR